MKKFFKLVAPMVVLCIVFAFSACSCDDSGIEEKKLAYAGKTLTSAVAGQDYSQSVAFATGADTIGYVLPTDSNLPEGLSLSPDGIVSGIPSEAVLNAKFKVDARAEGYTSATAEFTISITMSYSSYGLNPGTVGDSYSASVAAAIGSQDISYNIKTGSALPTGLTLSKAGVISGTPSEAVVNRAFTVVASADGLDAVEATFVITILPEDTVIEDLEFADGAFSYALIGTAYSASVTPATGTGNPVVSYTVKSGGNYLPLPAGLSMSQSGAVTGTPTMLTFERTVTVIASAPGFYNAEADYTIAVRSASEQTFVMEAEYVNVDDLQGGSWSGGGASGTDTIIDGREYGASNNWYITNLNVENQYFDFVFYSDYATTATLELRISYMVFDSEHGRSRLDVNPDDLRIEMNGTDIDYGTVSVVNGWSMVDIPADFEDHVFTRALPLKKGENLLRIEIMPNTLNYTGEGSSITMGPAFDAVKIKVPLANLKWEPILENLDGKELF